MNQVNPHGLNSSKLAAQTLGCHNLQLQSQEIGKIEIAKGLFWPGSCFPNVQNSWKTKGVDRIPCLKPYLVGFDWVLSSNKKYGFLKNNQKGIDFKLDLFGIEKQHIFWAKYKWQARSGSIYLKKNNEIINKIH